MAKLNIRELSIPTTYAAENILLGHLLGDQSHLPDLRTYIHSDTFCDENNRKLWDALCEADDAGHTLSIPAALTKTDPDHFQKNILPYAEGLVTATEMNEMGNDLAKASLCRDAYFSGYGIMQAASGGNYESAFAAARELADTINHNLRDNGTRPLADAVTEYGDLLQRRAELVAAGKALRVPTSIPTLDFATYGGFARGNLVILAARPSVGKTAIMLQMARAASDAHWATMIFSLEMTNAELVQRMLTGVTDLSPWDLANGRVDWPVFEQGAGILGDRKMFLNDKVFYFDEICNKILTASRQGNCDIAFIDYLGLISYRTKDGGQSIYEKVTAATRKLKQLAKDCNIPIVLLCQLNRDMSKEGRAPQLHDLRDSGSIEQDADIVLMLDRAIVDDDKAFLVNMYNRKNRQGRAGQVIHLLANATFNGFTEISEDEYGRRA